MCSPRQGDPLPTFGLPPSTRQGGSQKGTGVKTAQAQCFPTSSSGPQLIYNVTQLQLPSKG
jgi:hypothetical protein